MRRVIYYPSGYVMAMTDFGRLQYVSDNRFLIPIWEQCGNQRVMCITSPSHPAWTAQDIYDDANGLVRLTNLKA